MNAAQSIKLKLEATFPVPKKQSDLRPTYPFCSDCSTCGRSGKQEQPAKSPLAQVADILLKLAAGQYSPEQAEGIPEVIEALLKRHYENHE